MANLMDLIREIQGTRNQTAPITDPRTVGRGYDPELDGPTVEQMGGVYEPGIQVEGAVARPAPVDQSQYLLSESGAPDLNNTAWAQAAVEARNRNDKEVEHKGMFGVKGTLRNVLGVLGDAFLVQGGAKPVYAPQRQRERMGDAMAGHTQAPRAAAERMTAVDAEFAQEMGEKIAAQEVARANAQRLAQAEAAARYEKGVKIFGGMLGATDNETYEKMKPILQKLKDTYGLGDEYQIPEVFDPNYAAAVSSGSIDRYRQETLSDADQRIGLTRDRNAVSERQGDERIAIARQNAETARKRMEKSGSGGSRPRGDTAIEYFEALQDIPSSQRTPEQNAWIKKFTGTGTSRGGSTRREVTPNSRFKIRSVRDN